MFEPTKRDTTDSIVRNLDLFPLELKKQNIWLVAADEEGLAGGKIPHIVNDNGMLQRFGSYHEPLPYSAVEEMHEKYGYDVGILIKANNQITVVDLDAKGVSDEEYAKRMTYFKSLIASFDSYTELSQSGKGFHIICKSEVLAANNFRSLGVEVYSYRNRFMLCTGNFVTVKNDDVVLEYETKPFNKSNRPIGYKDDLITDLLNLAKSKDSKHIDDCFQLEERASNTEDDSIIDAILNSGLEESFSEILSYTDNTDFEKTKYPSASEVVLHFIGIVCRFTESNEQVRRIFRERCALAHRDKYTRNNYHLDRCLTIVRSELDMSEVDIFIENAVAQYQKQQKDILDRRIKAELDVLSDVVDRGDSQVDNELKTIASEYESEIEDFTDIQLPPGLAGEIAQYTLDSSPHKLKVAAIAASLASVAAIVGRQYRYNGSSLGNFFVVIGYSTMGKESANTALSTIAKAVAVSHGDGFFCFDKLSSGGALRTLMANSSYGSIVATLPEFALFIEQLKAAKVGGGGNVMSGLYSELLDVKTKDKLNSHYGSSAHANSENNRNGMEAPSFTFVGDCTPNFYEGISEEMMSSGFMSRLILLSDENTTKKMSDKKAHLAVLSKDVVNRLNMLTQHVINKYNANVFIPVELATPEVEIEADKLENYLKIKFNKSNNECFRQVYGRAYLKVMTIAASLAATENLGSPTITMKEFAWARNFIMRDIFIMIDKLNKGEIGVSEENCKRRVVSIFDKLLKTPKQRDKLAKSYSHVLDLGVMPRSLLSQRLQGNSFKIGNMSNMRTLDAILENMIKNGELQIVSEPKKEILSQYTGRSIRGMCYTSNEHFFDNHLSPVADWLQGSGRIEEIKFL